MYELLENLKGSRSPQWVIRSLINVGLSKVILKIIFPFNPGIKTWGSKKISRGEIKWIEVSLKFGFSP